MFSSSGGAGSPKNHPAPFELKLRGECTMAAPAKQEAAFSDFYGIPENTVGEIFDGELIVTPRPSCEHSHVEFALSNKLVHRRESH
jgi:hypothetical protein